MRLRVRSVGRSDRKHLSETAGMDQPKVSRNPVRHNNAVDRVVAAASRLQTSSNNNCLGVKNIKLYSCLPSQIVCQYSENFEKLSAPARGGNLTDDLMLLGRLGVFLQIL